MEMGGFEEVGNAIESLVVDENSAEQRLLRLDVLGSRAIGLSGLSDRPRRECHSQKVSFSDANRRHRSARRHHPRECLRSCSRYRWNIELRLGAVINSAEMGTTHPVRMSTCVARVEIRNARQGNSHAIHSIRTEVLAVCEPLSQGESYRPIREKKGRAEAAVRVARFAPSMITQPALTPRPRRQSRLHLQIRINTTTGFVRYFRICPDRPKCQGHKNLMTPTEAITSVEALQAIIDVVATPVFVKDQEHRWVLVNRALCEFMGHSQAELIGKSDFDFLPRHEAEVFWEKDDLVFTTGEENENEETITDRFGHLRTIITRKRLIHAADMPLLVAVITDITAFREEEAHSRYLAYHDTLSGLPNRALLNQRIDNAIAHPAGTTSRCHILIIDLDRFKQVNDAYGHAAGDELIREFAKRVTALLSTADTIARLGGDEFAVLLLDVQTAEGLTALCDRILTAARSPFVVAGVTVHVSASIAWPPT